MGLYRTEGMGVLVYANMYRVQTQDKELIHVGNSVAGSWRKLAESRVVPIGPGQFSEVVQTEADDGRRHWIIYHWYLVDGRSFSWASLAKLAQGLGVIAGRGDSGLVALAAPCLSDCEEARLQLDAFLVAMDGKIEGKVTDSQTGTQ
jgi:EpsI family protein